MTATDELRRLLDERGIEYTTLSYSDTTWWTDTNSLDWCYEENCSSTHLTCCSLRITPAQAIAATLGPREQPPHDQLQAENANLRELSTYALRHIVEVWCEGEGRDLYRGKPCEDCVDYGSSDCPKCMPRVFDVSGIEVD